MGLMIVGGAIVQAAPAGDCFSSGDRPYRVGEIAVDPLGSLLTLDLPLGIDYVLGRNTFGINRHLEVVFYAVTDPGPPLEVRAFVHLPVDNYGLDAGTYELPLPASPPGGGLVSVALDINDDGVIVGYVGEAVILYGDSDTKAFVWRLADSTLSNPPEIQPGESIHPTEIEETGCSSGAWAVNNDSPPWIAGKASRLWCNYPDPICDLDDPLYGFIIELDDANSARRLDGTGVAASRTFAISSTVPQIVVGLDTADQPPVFFPSCAEPTIVFECPDASPPVPNAADGLVWTVGTTIGRSELAPLIGIQAAAAAAGIDDDGVHIVGDSGCLLTGLATFWEDLNASPTNLSAVCGGDILARAEDIVTILACDETEEVVIAVGGGAQSRATVWSRVGGSASMWCCSELTGLALPMSSTGTDGEYDFDYAHAVAPTGHIVVHGRPRGTSATHVYLLTCAADIDGDGRVNGADLGELLANWGPCPQTGPCVADLNDDGVVDGADMGILLNAWTGQELCQIWPTSPVCGDPESFGGGDILAGFAVALDFLGFEDVDALASWYATASPEQREAVLETLNIIMLAHQPETE